MQHIDIKSTFYEIDLKFKADEGDSTTNSIDDILESKKKEIENEFKRTTE